MPCCWFWSAVRQAARRLGAGGISGKWWSMAGTPGLGEGFGLVLWGGGSKGDANVDVDVDADASNVRANAVMRVWGMLKGGPVGADQRRKGTGSGGIVGERGGGGAGGGTRTHTFQGTTDFESVTSTNSITPAPWVGPREAARRSWTRGGV